MGPVAQLMRCVVPAAVALLLIVVAPASGAVVAGPPPGLSAAAGIAYVYDAFSPTTTPGANVAFASVGAARSRTGLATARGSRQGRLLAAEEAASATDITFGHGARHLVGTGLRQGEVEAQIQAQVEGSVARASSTGSVWGRVTVGGQRVEYRAYTLPNGTINVGTYYVVP